MRPQGIDGIADSLCTTLSDWLLQLMFPFQKLSFMFDQANTVEGITLEAFHLSRNICLAALDLLASVDITGRQAFFVGCWPQLQAFCMLPATHDVLMLCCDAT